MLIRVAEALEARPLPSRAARTALAVQCRDYAMIALNEEPEGVRQMDYYLARRAAEEAEKPAHVEVTDWPPNDSGMPGCREPIKDCPPNDSGMLRCRKAIKASEALPNPAVGRKCA